MKKTTLFAILLIVAAAVNGQNILYQENFESYTVGDNVGEDTDIPSTFLSYDLDGDGFNWGLSNPRNFTQDMDLIYDENFIMSASYITIGKAGNGGQGALNANNILVLPKISIPSGSNGVELSYFVAGGTSSNFFSETYYVTVTNSSDQATILAATPIFTETLPTYLGRTIELSLEDYIGQDVYIAFRHQTADQWMLGFDDIKVEAVTLNVGNDVFKGFSYFVDNSNQLNLKSNQTLEKVDIFNVLGQKMISRNLSNLNESINISGLNSGIYIVSVKIAGREKSFKIVKS